MHRFIACFHKFVPVTIPIVNASFEIGTSLLLLWFLTVPALNQSIVFWTGGGMFLLWATALFLFRSRTLLTASLCFHFCFLLSFHTRAMGSAGSLFWWYAAICWVQWAAVLWFHLRHDRGMAALFLCIALISPLYMPVLNVRSESFIGVAFWILLVAHTFWIQQTRTEYPKFIFVWLAVALLPIPFALHYWRAVQFLWIQLAVVLLYCFLLGTPRKKMVQVLLPSYLLLVLSLLLYVVSRDAYTIPRLGVTVLAARHHIVEHANTLAPLFIVWSAILLYLAANFANRTMRVLVIAALIGLGCLEFLTYSRCGWIGYLAFLASCGAITILRQQRVTQRVKQAILICIISAIVVFAFSPVREMIFRRATDMTAARGRYFALKLGVQNVLQHPLVGTGWFNYYAHAKVSPEPPLNNILENRNLRDVHSHSMFVDLAEAGGLPMMLAFVALIVIHLRQPFKTPALTAGLIGITLNNLLDTASLWMTVYPHFWILLALRATALTKIGPGANPFITIRRAIPAVVVALLTVAMLARVMEDHFIQKGRFLQMANRSEEALVNLQRARVLAPLGVAPLESMLDVYLSQKNAQGAEDILERMMSLKREYAPYYTQMAKLKSATGDQESSEYLQRAISLDPHAALQGNPYILASYFQFLRGSNEYRAGLYRAMVAKPASMDAVAGDLVNAIPERVFISEAFRFANNPKASKGDRAQAIEQIYLALKYLNEPNLAVSFLEHALANTPDIPGNFRDAFPYLLAADYFSAEDKTKLRELNRQATTWAIPYVRGYEQLANGNLDLARNYFTSVTTAEDIDTGAWERYWKKTGKEESVRQYFEIIRRLPSHTLSSAYPQQIAASYLREGRFTDAAHQYQLLSRYDYADPFPHWMEARMWWLAGNREKAHAANHRLKKMLPVNPVLDRLYQSRILTAHPDHFAIVRAGLENDYGGVEWRTAIYAHPLSVIHPPSDTLFSRVSGELGMRSSTWSGETDGFQFALADSHGTELFTTHIDPAGNKTHRGWVPFEWNGKMQNITLRSLPRENSSYDWAFISIQSAQ